MGQKICNVLGVPWFRDERGFGWLINSCLCPHSGMIDDMAADMMDDITGNVTEMVPGNAD